jgi:signal transduction histidine kinase/ligand-binding sensor domain-containing protein
MAFGLLLACCVPSLALNSSLDISQYSHHAWTIRDGFFKGMVLSIAQTPDGYLWLGTEFGLLRFDGVRPVEWVPPGSDRLPSLRIDCLFTGRDGTLWIGTRAGLASWNGVKFTRYPEFDAKLVFTILEDHEGTIWVGGARLDRTGWLCGIRGAKTKCYGENGQFGSGVGSLYENGEGKLWVGASNGLWQWKPGPQQRYAMPEPELSSLLDGDDRKLLIATPNGIMRLVNGQAVPCRIRGFPMPRRPYRLFRDHDGSLWIGTAGQGLMHFHRGRSDVFSRLDGLSADEVANIFEDREGDIWVATIQGLDRFRELPVVTVSDKQGLANDAVSSVLATKEGSVWLAGRNGLDRWNSGKVTAFRKADGLPDYGAQSLFASDDGQIWVSSRHGLARFDHNRFFPITGIADGELVMTGSAADIWLLSYSRGLLRSADGRLIEEYPWPRLQHRPQASVIAVDRQRGGLWLGFWLEGGVAYFKDGKVQASYTSADGLGKGSVFDLQLYPDGSLWAATEGGLSVFRHGRGITLTSKNGLPCDTVYWRIEADDRSNGLYAPCGLVRVAPGELEAWASGSKRSIATTVFGGSDGVRLQSVLSTYAPHVSKDTDGRIWFVSLDGVSVFDPAHFPSNKLPPAVHIEQIVADDKKYEFRPGMRLPANVRSLRIEYTPLSLVAPEKVHFKYKLEGQNPNWHEVINERQVTYTNLSPKKYRFRVIASNNSGVWNETGDTLEFSIAPAYYQTAWFYASCVAAFLAMLWGLYRLRLYQIRREFNAQLDGRVEERMRVARELHDTLLQSFQASVILMQAARNIFERRPEKAVQSLDKAITTAAGAVAEGRSAIQDLRVHPAGEADLPQLFTAAGQELAHSGEAPGNPPAFAVTVEGERQNLQPLLQDEVYRITRELLRNAYRHAQAGRIEVEIRYESRHLRVHVRDDGKGIDAEILKAGGSTGHWGLPGMRERANQFGGKLEFWSEAGAGTEAVLTVPAAAAYANSNGGAFSFLRRKLWIHER